jgi:hypothetical protein
MVPAGPLIFMLDLHQDWKASAEALRRKTNLNPLTQTIQQQRVVDPVK